MGGSLTLIPIGATLEIHPVQVVDLFAGFVGVDFLRDDFARSRGLELSGEGRSLLMELARIERARPSLEAYLSAPPWQLRGKTAPGVARRDDPGRRAPR
jgi:hypothetical protein